MYWFLLWEIYKITSYLLARYENRVIYNKFIKLLNNVLENHATNIIIIIDIDNDKLALNSNKKCIWDLIKFYTINCYTI